MKEARPANIRSLLLSALVLSSVGFQAQAYYHPDEGRWISRDPIGDTAFLADYLKGKSPDQRRRLNQSALRHLYLFTRNNAIMFLDPLGLDVKNGCNRPIWVYLNNKWEKLDPGQTKAGDTDGVSWGNWGDHAKQAYKWIDCFDATVACTADGKCTITRKYVGNKNTKGKPFKIKCACAVESLANKYQGEQGGWRDPSNPDWPGKPDAPWPSPPDDFPETPVPTPVPTP